MKQPTLAKLDKLSQKFHATKKRVEVLEYRGQYGASHDRAKAAHARAVAAYWEAVEAVTEENPEYSEIIRNGHYE